MDNPETLANKR